VVGEWLSPQFFENDKGIFTNVTKKVADTNNNGLWQAIQPFDIDGDGDTDYLLGNWGLNTKFKASINQPLKMYVGDILKNGHWLTLVSFAKNDTYYSINTKDELQLALGTIITDKFKNYNDFAGKNFDEIIDKKLQNSAVLKTVQNLSSGYLENTNGRFIFKAFQESLQLASITSFLKADFDKDAIEEVLIAGNLFSVPPYNGKLDGAIGYILQKKEKIISGTALGLTIGNKQVKTLKLLKIGSQSYLIVVVNNSANLVYELTN
jgi:hypothetical protein